MAPLTGVLSTPPCTVRPSLAGPSWCLNVGTAWLTHMAPTSVFIRHWVSLVGALPQLTTMLLACSTPGSCQEGHLCWLKYAAFTIWWVGCVVTSLNADMPTSALSANAHSHRLSAGRGTGISFPLCPWPLPSLLPGDSGVPNQMA